MKPKSRTGAATPRRDPDQTSSCTTSRLLGTPSESPIRGPSTDALRLPFAALSRVIHMVAAGGGKGAGYLPLLGYLEALGLISTCATRRCTVDLVGSPPRIWAAPVSPRRSCEALGRVRIDEETS